MLKKTACAALCILLLFFCAAAAGAQAFDAQMAQAWFDELAGRIASMPASNDPAMTADPARAGQTLYAYDFGTVTMKGDARGGAAILEAELRGSQMTDCRGVSVGMGLEHALDGAFPGLSTTSLYVLGTQESGIGWSWAYVNEGGVYGVEYVSYGGDGMQMREYTLTYVIAPEGTISAIRMRCADATLAQAEQGLRTAVEMMSRQEGEVYAYANTNLPLDIQDMTVMGERALYAPVAELIARSGEPQEIQELADGRGRMLVYDCMVAELAFRKATGEEVVTSITTSSAEVAGPRGLTVGMTVQEAAGLFRCDSDVSSLGGVLYLEGEAKGEPPCGEILREAEGSMQIRYACSAEDQRTAVLEIGLQSGAVVYWHMYIMPENGAEAK